MRRRRGTSDGGGDCSVDRAVVINLGLCKMQLM
jgi:hypothetical protein